MVQNTLEKTKKLVWPLINKYLKDAPYPKQFFPADKYKADIDLCWKINREYPERKGKYLRPTLVLLTSQALGGNQKKALKVAAAMQLSEDWILIHDDIEDKSKERRGKPALQQLYGNELAINAGDALHTIMWKVISDIKDGSVIDEFYKILMRTILGQAVELMWTEKQKKTIGENDYFFIADGKSGYYSMAGPMRLGAIAAGATNSQINKITDFGLHLGRCFQLVDDILDIKQDKKEGKITLATRKGEVFAKKLAIEEKEIARSILEKELSFLSIEPARSQIKELIEFILERDY